MEWLSENYIYIIIAVVAYVVGKIHGRSDAAQELMYMQQQSSQQEAYSQYINSLQQVGEEQ